MKRQSCGSFENSEKVQALAVDKGNSQPNICGNTAKNVNLEDGKGITLLRYNNFFCLSFIVAKVGG